MTSYLKTKPVRDNTYLRNIASYGCVISGQDCIPHHLIKWGQGSIGGKASDYLTFPLSDLHHSSTYDTGIHKDVEKWERQWQAQPHYIKATLHRALDDGFISQHNYDTHIDICDDLLERFG